MNEKDFNNKPEINSEDYDFKDPMKAACSAEFSEGCIFCDEDT